MRYPPINPQLFIANRRRLTRQMKPNTLAVVNTNDLMPTNADGTWPFVQNSDLFYLTGIDQEDTTLLLYPDGVDGKQREILFIRKTSPEIVTWEGEKLTREQARSISGIETVRWSDGFNATFKPLAMETDGIYINTNEHLRTDHMISSRDLRFLEQCRTLFPLHAYYRLAPLMRNLRMVKSAEEVDLIKQACRITGQAFRRVLTFIRPGVWEFEIEAEIQHEFIKNRSRRPAYASIIAAGKSACILHYIRNDKQLKDGDLVLMDFGAEYANYASDLTRTVPVNGRFSQRQKQVYNAVLRIQREAMALLVPGKTLKQYNQAVGEVVEAELIGLGLLDADNVKRQLLDKPLYKRFFMHGISHHLGLDVHDVSALHRPFEAGMVFTCEPGIYIEQEGLGIRIENDILITDKGPVDLMADIPVEVEEIEAIMKR